MISDLGMGLCKKKCGTGCLLVRRVGNGLRIRVCIWDFELGGLGLWFGFGLGG